MEQKVNPAAIGARFGALAGLICIVLTLVLYLISSEMVFSFWFFAGFAVIVAAKIWAIWYVVKLKKYVEFKEGLQSAFMVSVVSLLIWTLFNSVLIGVIDKSLIETQKKVTIERTVKWMEKFNAPEDKIDETLDALEKEDYAPTFKKMAMNYAFSLFCGFVYAVILAGLFHYITQKYKPQITISPN
jgi:hypothetical protein